MVTSEQRFYLIAIYNCVNGSLSASVPINCITSKVGNNDKKYAKKQLKRLRSEGLVLIIPRERNKVYKLTRDGLNYIRKFIAI
ncbi:MAG: hypothetical protein HeimC3_47530 [Candidatus Heimdallarchaeota archaeon LC_3]|nr:MAG: hypothetical protein HeimC3_47530 [Candidatus Heimdallarchaeota archaeon LC_3]